MSEATGEAPGEATVGATATAAGKGSGQAAGDADRAVCASVDRGLAPVGESAGGARLSDVLAATAAPPGVWPGGRFWAVPGEDSGSEDELVAPPRTATPEARSWRYLCRTPSPDAARDLGPLRAHRRLAKAVIRRQAAGILHVSAHSVASSIQAAHRVLLGENVPNLEGPGGLESVEEVADVLVHVSSAPGIENTGSSPSSLHSAVKVTKALEFDYMQGFSAPYIKNIGSSSSFQKTKTQVFSALNESLPSAELGRCLQDSSNRAQRSTGSRHFSAQRSAAAADSLEASSPVQQVTKATELDYMQGFSAPYVKNIGSSSSFQQTKIQQVFSALNESLPSGELGRCFEDSSNPAQRSTGSRHFSEQRSAAAADSLEASSPVLRPTGARQMAPLPPRQLTTQRKELAAAAATRSMGSLQLDQPRLSSPCSNVEFPREAMPQLYFNSKPCAVDNVPDAGTAVSSQHSAKPVGSVDGGGISSIDVPSPMLQDIVDFGGIKDPGSSGMRSSNRIRAQGNADDTQLDRATELAKRRNEFYSPGGTQGYLLDFCMVAPSATGPAPIYGGWMQPVVGFTPGHPFLQRVAA